MFEAQSRPTLQNGPGFEQSDTPDIEADADFELCYLVSTQRDKNWPLARGQSFSFELHPREGSSTRNTWLVLAGS